MPLPTAKRLAVAAVLFLAVPALRADLASEAYAAKLAGDYPRAITLYTQLVGQEPANPVYYFQLGTVQGWAGRFSEALQTLEAGLARAPADPDLRLAQARVLAWTGQFPRAETEVREILAQAPHNLDAANLLGRILLWQRQFDAAEQVFQQILREAPENTDALVGSGDVERFQERYDAARSYYERALRTDPGSADLRQHLASVRQAGRWRLDLGWSHSTYTGAFPPSDWEGWDAALRYALDKKTGLSLSAEWARRFNLVDEQYSLGCDRRFTDALFGYVRASATPAADFFARGMLGLGGEWRVRAGDQQLPPTVLLGDYRTSRYAPGTAQSLGLGVTQYLPHHLSVLVKATASRNLNGHWTGGWQTRLDGDPAPDWHWGVGYADSRESLSSTLYDFLRELRNQAVFASLYHEFSPALGLRLDVSHEWSPGRPARNTLHAGLVTRF